MARVRYGHEEARKLIRMNSQSGPCQSPEFAFKVAGTHRLSALRQPRGRMLLALTTQTERLSQQRLSHGATVEACATHAASVPVAVASAGMGMNSRRNRGK